LGRRYSHTEREVLLAFAQHASLALGDARIIEAMREAQRSKEMFFAMVSHELKTPLAAIVGNLHTLIKNQHKIDAALQKEMMMTAHERAQELSGLINRILAGARAELASAKQDVFLPELINDAVRGFRESGALSMTSVPEILVCVDGQAVREVIGILLENALSHSHGEGAIFLESSADDGQVCVGVRNTGYLPNDIDTGSLFDAFQKGPDTISDGVGLGLYIASRLAQSIGGKIDVRTAEESVEFVLNWPLETPAGQEARDEKVSAR
jgi:signal transduction histidine kinase